MVELRPIPSLPHYLAGSDGNIYSCNYKRVRGQLHPRQPPQSALLSSGANHRSHDPDAAA